MAEGGATYTVNIELATRQFSQDLRDLKNKIKNELGKSVKVATTPDQKAEAKEKARKLREKRVEDQEARKRFYNADKINAFRVRQGRATAKNNELLKLGLKVEGRQKDIGAAMEAAEKGKFQWAEAKLKVANEQIKNDFKELDLINKQTEAEKKLTAQNKKKAEAEKKAQDRAKKVADAKKVERENKARTGPYGQRMYGPIDKYGTQVYTGYRNPKTPPVPKSGAALPIDLGRKGTGMFATQQTKLLRRREVLETLLKTFDGIKTDEVRKFKTGIESLLSQYEKISGMRGKMKPQGKQWTATGGWGEWKDGKLITKDKIGNAGEIARELEQLDNLTRKEESRAKRIKASNEAEFKAAKRRSAFLNKEHSARKLIERLKKKGLQTTELELKLEKAITKEDKEQLDAIAREIDMTNAKATRAGKASKSGGSGGGTTSAKTGGGGKWGRIGQSALISGGFPLLFGQSVGVASASAVGAGIGEYLTPGGGFAGGIITSAVASKVAEVIEFRKEVSNLNKDMASMGITSEFSAGQIAKLGKALRVTKQEALEIAKGFKRYGGKKGGLFAEFFGDAQVFETTARAIDIQSAIAAIKAQEKDMTPEQELQYRIMLQTEGVERTINSLVEKRIALRRKEFDEKQKEARKRAESMNAMDGTMVGFVLRQNQNKELEDQIEKEKELITQFEKERDLRNELALAAERQAQSINTAIESTEKELRKLNNAQYQVVELANSMSSAFSESFKGIVSGSMTAQEALRNLFQRTADHFLDMAARIIAEQIKMKILGIGLNFIASSAGAQANFGTGRDGTFGLGTHGSGIKTGAEGFGYSNHPRRAAGGPVSGGSPYIVGEKGPELFVPNSHGSIVPNHEMGGANVVVNVDASGSSVEGDAGQAEQLGSMLAAAVQAEIANQQRPGGLLARR